jgi:hypothetical protein
VNSENRPDIGRTRDIKKIANERDIANKKKEANDLLKLKESIAFQGKLIEDQKKEFRKREEVFKKREEDFKRREEESRRKHLEEIKNLKATILQDLKKEMPRETSTRSGNQYSKGLHHLV